MHLVKMRKTARLYLLLSNFEASGKRSAVAGEMSLKPTLTKASTFNERKYRLQEIVYCTTSFFTSSVSSSLKARSLQSNRGRFIVSIREVGRQHRHIL